MSNGPFYTNPIVVIDVANDCVHVEMAIDGGLYENVFPLSVATNEPYPKLLVNLAIQAQASGKSLMVWGEPGPEPVKGLPLFGITTVNIK
ncbi:MULTISPECIES: hypothetical protein [Serratia]|uniref:Uncharacterized protein n=1 Tax=Serratia marcescens SM39 TaxID=1334564 RepID=A0AAT9E5Z6_SERMA|nr:hypothetical protein [Serratia marcescens]AVE48406.1 hypothetical protein AM354_01690 [Serratia marcescens]KFB58077.1 hypothetical protein DH21_03095 [Serratia marcescens]MBH2546640.1 hypothetical protein [Serratia marcescens]MBH2591754.1 hypothetical protein [Serratia marcescens]MBH2971746.1 hypothetical protein [Serratia marcescens]